MCSSAFVDHLQQCGFFFFGYTILHKLCIGVQVFLVKWPVYICTMCVSLSFYLQAQQLSPTPSTFHIPPYLIFCHDWLTISGTVLVFVG